jgi:hypothetical protein
MHCLLSLICADFRRYAGTCLTASDLKERKLSLTDYTKRHRYMRAKSVKICDLFCGNLWETILYKKLLEKQDK